MEIRRILLPTDFSEVSSVALEYAIDMMRRYGAKLYIIHVIHDISKRIGGWYTPHPSVDEMSKDIESAAKKELERFGLEELRRQKDVERVVLKGTPQEEIIKFANKNKIDLIIIGATTKKGVGRLLFGSTATPVVRSAPCPVLTVRPAAHEE